MMPYQVIYVVCVRGRDTMCQKKSEELLEAGTACQILDKWDILIFSAFCSDLSDWAGTLFNVARSGTGTPRKEKAMTSTPQRHT